MRSPFLSLSLLLTVVLSACPPASPPIDGVEGEGEEGEGEEGEGEGEEGEGEGEEGEGEGEEGEGEGGEGEGEGVVIPPILLITPEGGFCLTCEVQVGRTLQLTATAFVDGAIVPGTPTWSIDDESVATISDAGLVTGVALGTATVSAELGGVSGTLEIEVTDTATVVRIEVDPPEVTLAVGATVQLDVTAFDADDNLVEGVAVTFTGVQTDIATVDVAGLVTAVGVGEALILVQAGNAFGQSRVTVEAP